MAGPSEYTFERTYHDKIKAAILDWSGTLADAYVIAPAVFFVEVFKNQGIEISIEEARGPMGLRKDSHIQKLTEDPEIIARWRSHERWLLGNWSGPLLQLHEHQHVGRRGHAFRSRRRCRYGQNPQDSGASGRSLRHRQPCGITSRHRRH